MEGSICVSEKSNLQLELNNRDYQIMHLKRALDHRAAEFEQDDDEPTNSKIADLIVKIAKTKTRDVALADITAIIEHITRSYYAHGLRTTIGYSKITDNRDQISKMAYFLWQSGYSDDPDTNWFEAEKLIAK